MRKRNKPGARPAQLWCSADEGEAELWIMGDICQGGSLWGDGSTSSDDVAALVVGLPKTISELSVHVNSYGGDVKEGVAIYNALRSHPAHVTTYCEGMACSIASVVFMAGDRRVMRHASLLMLHNPWMDVTGNSAQLRKAADDLDEVAALSVAAYLDAGGVTVTDEELAAAMDAETWVGPAQALEWGLATEVEEAEESAAPTQGAREAVMAALTAQEPRETEARTWPLDLSEASCEALAAHVAALLAPAQGAAPAPQAPEDPFAALAARMRKNHQ